MKGFTPSKRALLRSCSRWLLPGVSWVEVEVERDEYEKGRDFHAAMDAYVRSGMRNFPLHLDVSSVPETRHAADWLQRQHLLGKRFDSEVKVAWNVLEDTARFLPSGTAPRDYSGKTPDEKAGTVDLIELDGGRVIVWDWQTTHLGGDPPDKKDQLRTYALWVARVYEVDHIGIGELLVTEKGVYPSEVEWLDEMALDAECEMLRAELAQSPEPKPGPWCRERRCPAIGSCEATAEHAAQIIPAHSLASRFRFTTEIESQEHARWLLVATEMVKEALAPLRQALEEYADAHGGIASGDGRSWSGAPKSSETPSLDVPGALDLIREAGAADAIEHKTSWASIERVIGKERTEQLRAALRARGATRASSYNEYRWRKEKLGRTRAA